MVHDDVPRLHDRSGRTPAAPPATVQPAYEDLDPDTQVFDVYTGTQVEAGSGHPVGPRPGPYVRSFVLRPAQRPRGARTVLAALGGGAAALLVLAVVVAALSATVPSPAQLRTAPPYPAPARTTRARERPSPPAPTPWRRSARAAVAYQ